MSKNKLTDLNDHLFAQIERLSDEDLSIEDLEKEIARSQAINSVAKEVMANARLVLEATQASAENMGRVTHMPKMLDHGAS